MQYGEYCWQINSPSLHLRMRQTTQNGNHFCLRIPEGDVVEFANTLLKAYKEDIDGKVKVTPPHIHITENGNVIHDGKVERIKD